MSMQNEPPVEIDDGWWSWRDGQPVRTRPVEGRLMGFGRLVDVSIVKGRSRVLWAIMPEGGSRMLDRVSLDELVRVDYGDAALIEDLLKRRVFQASRGWVRDAAILEAWLMRKDLDKADQMRSSPMGGRPLPALG